MATLLLCALLLVWTLAGSLLVSLLVGGLVATPYSVTRLPGLLFAGLFLFSVAGCIASSPLSEGIRARVEPALTPQSAVRDYPQTQGRELLWGGTILQSRNLADSTELTVIASPINHSGRPQTASNDNLGRFIVVQPGYLETADFAPGRQITVYGRMIGIREAAIGEASQREPVMGALQVHLWRDPGEWEQRPLFNFGIGFSGGF